MEIRRVELYFFSFPFSLQKIHDRQQKKKMESDEMHFHMGSARPHLFGEFLGKPESIP